MRDRPVLLGSLIVLAAASGFGLLGPLARWAYDAGFDPLSFVAWRAAFGLLIVALVVAVRVHRGTPFVNPLGLPTRDRIALLLAGVAGLGLNVGMFFGFQVTSVAVTLLAFYTYPALVALVAAALGHERLDRSRIVALVLALGGMVLVVAGGIDPSTGALTINPLGVVLGLSAAAWQTLFVTISRNRYRTVPSEQATGWILVITSASCTILALVAGGNLGAIAAGPRPFALAAITGVIAAGIPSVLFLVGIRSIGGTRAGILMLFEPLVGVTLAGILLAERTSPVQLLGGVAILAAAVLIQRGAGTASVSTSATRSSAGSNARAESTIEPAAVPSPEGG